MKDLWRDEDAGADDIAQLVYLSNLIGADVDLVQPGGGNTSVKLEEDDVFGDRVEALAVKAAAPTCARSRRPGSRTLPPAAWPSPEPLPKDEGRFQMTR